MKWGEQNETSFQKKLWFFYSISQTKPTFVFLCAPSCRSQQFIYLFMLFPVLSWGFQWVTPYPSLNSISLSYHEISWFLGDLIGFYMTTCTLGNTSRATKVISYKVSFLMATFHMLFLLVLAPLPSHISLSFCLQVLRWWQSVKSGLAQSI